MTVILLSLQNDRRRWVIACKAYRRAPSWPYLKYAILKRIERWFFLRFNQKTEIGFFVQIISKQSFFESTSFRKKWERYFMMTTSGSIAHSVTNALKTWINNLKYFIIYRILKLILLNFVSIKILQFSRIIQKILQLIFWWENHDFW